MNSVLFFILWNVLRRRGFLKVKWEGRRRLGKKTTDVLSHFIKEGHERGFFIDTLAM